MGFFSSFYISTDINELCNIYPSKSAIIIGVINAMFDASGKSFLNPIAPDAVWLRRRASFLQKCNISLISIVYCNLISMFSWYILVIQINVSTATIFFLGNHADDLYFLHSHTLDKVFDRYKIILNPEKYRLF